MSKYIINTSTKTTGSLVAALGGDICSCGIMKSLELKWRWEDGTRDLITVPKHLKGKYTKDHGQLFFSS